MFLCYVYISFRLLHFLFGEEYAAFFISSFGYHTPLDNTYSDNNE